MPWNPFLPSFLPLMFSVQRSAFSAALNPQVTMTLAADGTALQKSMTRLNIDASETDKCNDYLTSLPHEILCCIVSFCQILDVIQIRQASKLLHSISFDRDIWLNILVGIGEIVDVPMAVAFPLPTLSASHIEHIAISHVQFFQTIRKGKTVGTQCHDDALQYLSTRTIPFCQDTCEISCIRFLPGGRYMLTLSHEIELWDLGSFNRATPTSLGREILEVEVNSTSECIFNCFVPCDQGFDVSVVVYNENPGRTALIVYNINPSEPSPKFRRVGQHEFATDVIVHSYTRGHFAYIDHGINSVEIGVYDIASGLTVMLESEKYSDDEHAPDYQLEFTHHDRAIVISSVHGRFLDVFELPDFTSYPQKSSVFGSNPGRNPLYLVVSPSASFCWSPDIHAVFPSITTHSLGISGIFYFETIELLDNGRTLVQQKQLSLEASPTSNNKGLTWSLETIHSGHYPALQIFHKSRSPEDKPYSFMFPDKSRLLIWEDQEEGSSIQLHLSTLSKDLDSTTCDYPHKMMGKDDPHLDDRQLYWNMWTFTPLLGRLAMSNRQLGVVHILDYVS